jgi:hypothetical protein
MVIVIWQLNPFVTVVSAYFIQQAGNPQPAVRWE